MHKHKGFPSRLPGTDFQFTIRRENKKGATPLVARERYADRRPADKRADLGFLWSLYHHFGEAEFERGNLDAGRLSWVFGREVIGVDDPFDPESYAAVLRLDISRLRGNFPELFDPSVAQVFEE
ncbi:MAG: hypothetical protein AAGA12_13115 [Pseudomonadota bacterium]